MKIIILLLFMFYWIGLTAQTALPVSQNNHPSSFISNPDYQVLWSNQVEFTSQTQGLLFQNPKSNLFLKTPNCLPGMFCKMEYKIETKSKLAPRFRLGSLNYTNWLEGKTEWYNRY